MRTLESEVSKPSEGTGFLQTNWMWPWRPSYDAESDTQQVVTTTFQDVMNLFVTQTSQVVLHCEYALSKLDRLEEHLHVVHDMLSRERVSVTGEQSELLSEL